jgi:hypothetical protein
VTAGGGTGASLAVQAFTIDQQIRLEERRVEERAKELRQYIIDHGALPSDKDLEEYYGLNDEEIMLLKNDVSGYKPIRGLVDVPEDERDGYVVQQALNRAANPPNDKDGLPEVATVSLDLHIRERMSALDAAIQKAPAGEAEKLKTRRDAFASLLPGLQPHIEHEKQVKARQERREKDKRWREWKKMDDARKKAEAEAANKKAPERKPATQGAAGPTLLPQAQPAGGTADPLAPFGPTMEDPEQKFAREFVEKAGFWGKRLAGDGKKLVNRIHSDSPPSDKERSAFLAEEALWRKTVTDWMGRFQQQGRGAAVSGLQELLGTRGTRLQELRTYLGG